MKKCVICGSEFVEQSKWNQKTCIRMDCKDALNKQAQQRNRDKKRLKASNLSASKRVVSSEALDEVWRKMIKERDKRCIFCNATYYLEAHHIFGRTARSTRWYLPNGVTLCMEHHFISTKFSAHGTELKFREFIKGYLGENEYAELELKARTINKRPIEELHSELVKTQP